MVRRAAKGTLKSRQTWATAAPSISTASASGKAARSAALSALVATKRSPLAIRPRCTRGACKSNSATASAPSVSAARASTACAARARLADRSASVSKRATPVSGTSKRGNSGEASMSCCMKLPATTTSPTRTPSPTPPAVPVKTMRSTLKRSISNVAVVAAATLPTRESTATTS